MGVPSGGIAPASGTGELGFAGDIGALPGGMTGTLGMGTTGQGEMGIGSGMGNLGSANFGSADFGTGLGNVGGPSAGEALTGLAAIAVPIVGSILGGILAGPFGAVAGGALGNFGKGMIGGQSAEESAINAALGLPSSIASAAIPGLPGALAGQAVGLGMSAGLSGKGDPSVAAGYGGPMGGPGADMTMPMLTTGMGYAPIGGAAPSTMPQTFQQTDPQKESISQQQPTNIPIENVTASMYSIPTPKINYRNVMASRGVRGTGAKTALPEWFSKGKRGY
jgi:hypothetical protein